MLLISFINEEKLYFNFKTKSTLWAEVAEPIMEFFSLENQLWNPSNIRKGGTYSEPIFHSPQCLGSFSYESKDYRVWMRVAMSSFSYLFIFSIFFDVAINWNGELDKS